jgi:hypothetical protein
MPKPKIKCRKNGESPTKLIRISPDSHALVRKLARKKKLSMSLTLDFLINFALEKEESCTNNS